MGAACCPVVFQLFFALEDGDEDFHNLGVKLRSGMAAQFSDGILPRHRLAVGALVLLGGTAHHGIEGIHDGDDAGLDRDLIFL